MQCHVPATGPGRTGQTPGPSTKPVRLQPLEYGIQLFRGRLVPVRMSITYPSQKRTDPNPYDQLRGSILVASGGETRRCDY